MTDLTGRRITFVLPSLDLSGAERQALLLAKYLSQRQGARVDVWGFGKAGSAAALCEQNGLPWRSIPFGLSSTNRGRFINILKFSQELFFSMPEVVLPYCYQANLLCGLTWRFAGIRECIWNQRDEGRHFTGQRLEELAAQLTRVFVSNSHHGSQFLTGQLGVPPSKVRVVHNGVEPVDPKFDRAVWRERLNMNEDSFLACMVANLTKSKDHATLLKAWRRVIDALDQKKLSAVLALAGAFVNTHESLKALAYDLDLGKSVRFLGAVTDISGLLGAVDLAVFSSRLEGIPNGVLESMSAGLAVVGTDIPGIREALPEDGYAYLSPPGDDVTLAQGILDLHAHPERRMQLGASNRQWIKRFFDPEHMCREMTDLILDGLS